MRISKLSICVLVSVIVLSVFVASLSNLLAVNYDNGNSGEKVGGSSKSNHIQIGDKFEHLIWFIQISDIHLSIFHDPTRIQDFRIFCNSTLDAINPLVVLASGDLADAKAEDNMGSKQEVKEWEYYRDILGEFNVVNKTLWLDIRGNHDNFNVPSIFSEHNYFHRYSIQGKKHLRSYMYTINKGMDKYSFIGVDACLDPGPRRPFNFFGIVSPDQFQMLKQFESDSRKSNATFWFGHYPTSCIHSQGRLRKLMGSGIAYFCGHLHTLGGLVPGMYTLQKTGNLELELGDWKDARLFRIAAMDHGLFSFKDVRHGTWPIILITNPKHALFVLPKKEPIDSMKESTHIRLLVFPSLNNSLEIVRVRLDEGDWIQCQKVGESPLWVAKWNPKQYANGIHQIEVYARDSSGQSNEIMQEFSLDKTRMSFSFLPRLTLMSDARDVFFFGFIVLIIISVLPLVVIKVLHNLVRDKRIDLPDLHRIRCVGLVRKFWVLASVNKLFYPLIIYPIYITFGPWLIGEVIEGHLGLAFAWGTFVAGKFLPGSFTYFYGCIQMFWFHIPLLYVIAHCTHYRFKEVYFDKSPSKVSALLCKHLPCAMIITVQTLFAFFFWQAYGSLALILGPFRSWSVILGVYLWYYSSTLTKRDLREAKILWGKREPQRACDF